MSPRIRQLLPGLLVSGGFTAWFILRADWGSVGGALRGVHLGWVAAVGAALFLEHVVRAIRWRVLVRDIAPEVTPSACGWRPSSGWRSTWCFRSASATSCGRG